MDCPQSDFMTNLNEVRFYDYKEIIIHVCAHAII